MVMILGSLTREFTYSIPIGNKIDGFKELTARRQIKYVKCQYTNLGSVRLRCFLAFISN